MSDFPDPTNWAVTAFADADLGDLRRTQRLIHLAHTLAQNPGATLPEACGSSAMLKAAYRFFDNDDIEPSDIVQSHIEATYGRLHHVPVVLAVQDTTEANWTTLRATEGLGPLGCSAYQSLLVHTTLAITPERVPLGLLAQQVWARDPDDVGKRARRKQLPISQKAKSGSIVSTPSSRLEIAVLTPTWSVWATAKPMSTTFWPSSGRRASMC
jgi:Transposase DNA-binding